MGARILWVRILGASLLMGPCYGVVAMSVSGDPTDGSYTISWESGSTYRHTYQFDGYDYYELFERVDDGSWATNSTWLNVSSVSFTGKAAGTYEYKLVWRYGLAFQAKPALTIHTCTQCRGTDHGDPCRHRT